MATYVRKRFGLVLADAFLELERKTLWLQNETPTILPRWRPDRNDNEHDPEEEAMQRTLQPLLSDIKSN
jgi:hypothetical protein